MKRIYALLLAAMTLLTVGTLHSTAQTQRGCVRTLGRPTQRGQALSGVTIRVKGEHNMVLSDADGAFALAMPGKKNGEAYALQQVRKTGYELNEAGVIGRPFAFSDKVPLTIVMVSTAQLQADKQRIENTAYQVALRNYKTRMEELERQRDAGQLAVEQYRTEIQALQDKFEKYQSLIDDLAEHYAHTDYDLLDEHDREICLCIERGDLNRADSLIHTLFDPLDVLRRNQEALARIDQSEAEARQLLAQANEEMAAVLKQQEKDAEYLYQLFTIATTKFDNEKARFYIETRAQLDTTNAKWLLDAGEFLEVTLGMYDKALEYFNAALNTPDISQRLRLVCWTDIASIKEYQGKYTEAIQMNEQALSLAKDLNLKGNTAILHNNIGNEYRFLEDYDRSISHIDKSIRIWESITEEDLSVEKPRFSKSYYLIAAHTSIAQTYDFSKQYEKALSHLNQALSICNEQSTDMSSSLARIYSTMGSIYNSKQDYNNALLNFNNALHLYSKVYGEKHPYVGITYHNIGDNYAMIDDYDRSIEHLQKAISIKEACYGEQHPSTAMSFTGIGVVLYLKGDINRSLEYLYHALNIYLETYGDKHSLTKNVQETIDLIKSK